MSEDGEGSMKLPLQGSADFLHLWHTVHVMKSHQETRSKFLNVSSQVLHAIALHRPVLYFDLQAQTSNLLGSHNCSLSLRRNHTAVEYHMQVQGAGMY